MKLIFNIALRYLFGKKSTNAINVITWVSIIGMSIGSAALILILSVFNGFETLLSGMLSHFNPDIKVTLVEGKYRSKDSIDIEKIKKIKGIEAYSFTIEETSFFEYKGSQEVGIIKGVDQQFLKVTGLDTVLVSGSAKFGQEVSYAIMGSGMNTKLSINASDGTSTVTAYMPSNKNGSGLGSEFNGRQFYCSGTFSLGSDVDMQYVLVNFDLVNELLGLDNHYNALEIKLAPDAEESEVMDDLKSALGNGFYIKNRAQQDDGFLKIMNIEKWISYLISCLTMLMIAFNLVGTLWMIVLEKKKDIAILKSMGMTKWHIQKIFLWLGLCVSGIGLMIGSLLSLILYVLQKNYGLIRFPDGFLVNDYPIEMRWTSYAVVCFTVAGIGILASYIPSKRAGRVSTFVRQT